MSNEHLDWLKEREEDEKLFKEKLKKNFEENKDNYETFENFMIQLLFCALDGDFNSIEKL